MCGNSWLGAHVCGLWWGPLAGREGRWESRKVVRDIYVHSHTSGLLTVAECMYGYNYRPVGWDYCTPSCWRSLLTLSGYQPSLPDRGGDLPFCHPYCTVPMGHRFADHPEWLVFLCLAILPYLSTECINCTLHTCGGCSSYLHRTQTYIW